MSDQKPPETELLDLSQAPKHPEYLEKVHSVIMKLHDVIVEIEREFPLNRHRQLSVTRIEEGILWLGQAATHAAYPPPPPEKKPNLTIHKP